jgi:hypothetical protein
VRSASVRLALSKTQKARLSAFGLAFFGKASGYRLERFQPAYAVHRGDACQLLFCRKLAEILGCHVLKITAVLWQTGLGGAVVLLLVARGASLPKARAYGSGKPPSARYGGRVRNGG